jgi:hypothetical protein
VGCAPGESALEKAHSWVNQDSSHATGRLLSRGLRHPSLSCASPRFDYRSMADKRRCPGALEISGALYFEGHDDQPRGTPPGVPLLVTRFPE